jgi:hypothetical protein
MVTLSTAFLFFERTQDLIAAWRKVYAILGACPA